MLRTTMIAGKRALVFGGAGFIGRHLVAGLLARGYDEVTSADIRAPGIPLEQGMEKTMMR